MYALSTWDRSLKNEKKIRIQQNWKACDSEVGKLTDEA